MKDRDQSNMVDILADNGLVRQGASVKAAMLSGLNLKGFLPVHDSKNCKNHSSDRLYFYGTCLTGQVDIQVDLLYIVYGTGDHLMLDRWTSNLTCPIRQVTLKVKVKPWLLLLFFWNIPAITPAELLVNGAIWISIWGLFCANVHSVRSSLCSAVPS